MIKSFLCPESAALFAGQSVRRFVNIHKVAIRKLRYLNDAVLLSDLKAPPGNRLEALFGDRAGRHSIRINDQWRICFCWENGDAYEVEIVDYH